MHQLGELDWESLYLNEILTWPNKLSDLGHCSLVIARTSHPETMMTPAVHYWWLLITHDDWEERSFFVWSCILVNGAETRVFYTSETLDKWTGACKLETTKYPSRSLEHFMLCKYLIIVEMFSCHPLLPSFSPLYLISAQFYRKNNMSIAKWFSWIFCRLVAFLLVPVSDSPRRLGL